jgi:hypothetical protein
MRIRINDIRIIVDVPLTSFASAVTSLDSLHSVLNDIELALGDESSSPALNDSCTCGLVKHAMRFQAIVRMLSQEDFGFS